MPERLAISLTQLALWYDPTRIQTWPHFLASLAEGAVARTPTDLGREYATARMTSPRHASAFNLVRNLPGLEARGRQLQLRGVGLLERLDRGYRVSRSGRKLAGAYRTAPDGSAWPRMLADLLLGREPRIRAFVRLLSKPDATLVFDRDGWFAGSYRLARIESAGQPDSYPLDGAEGRLTLRERLGDDAWWCLGDWRRAALLEGATDCRFRGVRGDAISLHDIGLALRAACEVLLVVGLLRTAGGAVRLDLPAAASLLPERAEDFGWPLETQESGGLLPALAELLPMLRSPTGHVVASELRAALRDRGVVDPDRAIAAAECEGRVHVYAEDYGQSRHGSGLFGDPRKQLVKLRIVTGVQP